VDLDSGSKGWETMGEKNQKYDVIV